MSRPDVSNVPRQTVLFVDDEPHALRGYRDTTHKEPYDVALASSAHEALQVLATQQVNVVVSDERMPVMSGSELLERIHRQYPDVVRVMLTGQASLTASVQAINDGLYRFLSKPIAPADLRRVIHDALRIKTLRLSSSAPLRRKTGQAGIGLAGAPPVGIASVAR